MSGSSDDKKKSDHRTVKWSPPYRRENVEMPEFDLIEIEFCNSKSCIVYGHYRNLSSNKVKSTNSVGAFTT